MAKGKGGGQGNPKWSKDEVIVAMDFYFAHRGKLPGRKSPEIAELSEMLRLLRQKLGHELTDTFRNPTGIHMTLMTFESIDPEIKRKGLGNVSQNAREVFRRYRNNQAGLSNVARAIRDLVELDEPHIGTDILDEDIVEVQEGRLLTRYHRFRERDKRIVRLKKEKSLDEFGSLQCEGCVFDFSSTYGSIGNGFIECHHTKPVSQIRVGERTTLDDLSLVCSNCHRMIHRNRPWLSLDQLRSVLLHKG